MSDLVEFLRARLDEDERIARDATPGPWFVNNAFSGQPGFTPVVGTMRAPGYSEIRDVVSYGAGDGAGGGSSAMVSLPNAYHIARHNPIRVLAEVEAKRALLAEHARYSLPDGADVEECRTCGGVNEAWPCPTLRLLALPYAAHPGYRPEWAPTT